jgi:hypothetical protein
MRACIDLLKCAFLLVNPANRLTLLPQSSDTVIVRSHSGSRNHGSNGARRRTAIVEHGKPGVWHGTSATAPAKTVARASDAEVLDGLRGGMDSLSFP